MQALHPPDWQNPTPLACYELIVLGGGPAGLVAAYGAAGLGAKVAIVERDRLGGDCLIAGCVPSKALLSVAHRLKNARKLPGITLDYHLDRARVLDEIRTIRASFAEEDGAERLKQAGVHVFFGEPQFIGENCIKVERLELKFKRAILAVGAAPIRLPDTMDTATFFELEALPAALNVLGGGPAGCELAQALACLGTTLYLFEQGSRILSSFSEDAARVIHQSLIEDGVQYGPPLPGIPTLAVIGRKPRLESLGLKEAGIKTTASGLIQVDSILCTSNPHVWAAGDCCGGGSTHAADAQARLALRNAFFPGSSSWKPERIPTCVYTLPEAARVGRKTADCIRVPLNQVHRLRLEQDSAGFLDVYIEEGYVVGAEMVGMGAVELINALALLIPLTPAKLQNWIPAYPSQLEALHRVGSALQRRRLTPFLARLIQLWLKWGIQ
jgi:pyruvate/2-oxoglutarate dehydrogenase complex dihydrolipoamide dehydrogenase (E3) component